MAVPFVSFLRHPPRTPEKFCPIAFHSSISHLILDWILYAQIFLLTSTTSKPIYYIVIVAVSWDMIISIFNILVAGENKFLSATST